jgi:hypothetical protein
MSTMSTASLENGPVLVSDLPPVTSPLPGLLDAWTGRLRRRYTEARDRRAFERAVRFAGPNEHHDLLVQARRG